MGSEGCVMSGSHSISATLLPQQATLPSSSCRPPLGWGWGPCSPLPTRLPTPCPFPCLTWKLGLGGPGAVSTLPRPHQWLPEHSLASPPQATSLPPGSFLHCLVLPRGHKAPAVYLHGCTFLPEQAALLVPLPANSFTPAWRAQAWIRVLTSQPLPTCTDSVNS